MPDSALTRNVIGPAAWGLFGTFMPGAFGSPTGTYPGDPAFGGGSAPPSFDWRSAMGGFGGGQGQAFGGGGQAWGQSRVPIQPPGGGGGPPGLGSPSSSGMDPYMMQNMYYAGLGKMLGGQTVAGPSAQESFLNAYTNKRLGDALTTPNGFNNWFGDPTDPNSGIGGLMKSQMTTQFGGRAPDGSVLNPAKSDAYQGLRYDLTSLGGNFVDPSKAPDILSALNQQRMKDPYFANPMQGATDILGLSRNNPALDPRILAQEQAATAAGGPQALAIGRNGVQSTKQLSNQYEQSLMDSIDQQTKNTLAAQTPELMAQMQAMGITNGGSLAAQGGDLVKSIMDSANQQKIQALANFRQNDINNIAQAIGQRTQVGAQAANQQQAALASALGLGQQFRGQQGQQAFTAAANQYGQGIGDRNAALNSMYGAGANLAGQQLGAQNDWRNLQSQLYANMLSGQSQQALQANIAQQQAHLAGLNAYQGLYGLQQNNLNQLLQQGLAFGGADQQRQQAMIDAQMRGLFMPYQGAQQLATGINGGTGWSPSPAISPLGAFGLNVGANALGGMFGGGQQQQSNFGPWGGSVF